MKWPQLVVTILLVLSVWAALDKHGEVDPKPKNAFTSLISLALWVWVLYMGGFWS